MNAHPDSSAPAASTDAWPTPIHSPSVAAMQLAKSKVTYVKLKTGTKQAAWCKGRRSYTQPAGDAGLYPSANMLVVDIDSAKGRWLIDMLDLPDTYTVGTRHGCHLYFLLPKGIKIKQRIRMLTGVDFITTGYVVAPGSTVEGFSYQVIKDVPMAELSEFTAQNIADLAADPDNTNATVAHPTWPGLTTPESRRACARRARQMANPESGMAKRQKWLDEDRDGRRHQAMYSVALQMGTYGETIEDFLAAVMASPVRCKLPVTSPERWLSGVWNSAQARQGGAPVIRWRDTGAARRSADYWLDDAQRDRRLSSQAKELAALVRLWVCRFGFGFYLAHSTMREWLGLKNWRYVRRYLEELKEAGWLIEHSRDDLHPAQATYFGIMFAGEVMEGAPPSCTSLYHGVSLEEEDEGIAALLRVAEVPAEAPAAAMPPPWHPPPVDTALAQLSR